MKNGDISNETPHRLIVLADVVVETEEVTERKLLSKVTSLKVKNIKKSEVYKLWMVTEKYGLSVELAGIEEDGWTQSSLDTVISILDRRGGNPFNFAQTYITTQELVDDMPYRINLRGVVDLPSKQLLYGSWGVDLDRL